MFDDWGMFAYTNGAFKSWGDYLTEIDIGIWEMKWDDESWAAWWMRSAKSRASPSSTGAPSPLATAPAVRERSTPSCLELGGGFEDEEDC